MKKDDTRGRMYTLRMYVCVWMRKKQSSKNGVMRYRINIEKDGEGKRSEDCTKKDCGKESKNGVA